MWLMKNPIRSRSFELFAPPPCQSPPAHISIVPGRMVTCVVSMSWSMGRIVPPVTMGDDVRGAVFEVEIVEGDERVAKEVRVRSGDRPEPVVLVQDLPPLAGKYV